jgi:FkbM family methyltransferase
MNIQHAMNDRRAAAAKRFAAEFSRRDGRPKFVFGCNVYGHALAEQLPINGFIDDFTKEPTFLDLPVLRMNDVPRGALVLVAAGGRPFTALERVERAGFECLDYFAFYSASGLPLREVAFNEGFVSDYQANAVKYERIFDKLADRESRETFEKLISFRLTYDLDCLRGFTARESEQYFEPFLKLKQQGETFVDVGSFDGFTSQSFIERCPNYTSVHVFEPDPHNMERCKARLSGQRNITFHQLGLSNKKQQLNFDIAGSSSRISQAGSIQIVVDRLDDTLDADPTLIKMDIEGAEFDAVEGATETIARAHPRLALSIYHNAGDFWRLPERILDIRSDYRLFIRHYTESIYETVMFFQPDV